MEIRLAKEYEVEELQRFLHDHWAGNHILSKNRDLLDYQHYNDGEYNFVIAKDDKIYAALGFIPTRQYDPSIERLDIWLAIWKKSPDCPKGVGVKLLDWIEDTLQPDTIGAIGINDQIEQLYLSRGWRSGVLRHYYLPVVDFGLYEGEVLPPRVQFVEVNENIPAKSRIYHLTRYSLHPFYKYQTYQIAGAWFVFRKCERALRIVDIFGWPDRSIEPELNALMKHYGCAYVDLLCVVPSYYHLFGLQEKPRDLILPNWFEPLVMEHKPIKYAWRGPDEYFVFKGDSDQDRPNANT